MPFRNVNCEIRPPSLFPCTRPSDVLLIRRWNWIGIRWNEMNREKNASERKWKWIKEAGWCSEKVAGWDFVYLGGKTITILVNPPVERGWRQTKYWWLHFVYKYLQTRDWQRTENGFQATAAKITFRCFRYFYLNWVCFHRKWMTFVACSHPIPPKKHSVTDDNHP